MASSWQEQIRQLLSINVVIDVDICPDKEQIHTDFNK